jgi:NAD kinase
LLRFVNHSAPTYLQEWMAEFQAMNEAMIHRGREAHLATIDCYSGDTFLTDAKVRFLHLVTSMVMN